MKHQKRRFQKSANTPEAEKTVEEVKIEPTENKIKENKKRPIRRFNRRFRKDAKEANESNDPNEVSEIKFFLPNAENYKILFVSVGFIKEVNGEEKEIRSQFVYSSNQ